MTVQTMTGTLHEAEQALADVQKQYHDKQDYIGRLTRSLVGIDQDPQTLTGETFAQREADRRNWTKQRTQAQQAMQMLQREVESATAHVQRLRARVRELPGLIARLQRDLTKEGRFGIELFKAEQAVIIVHNQLKSHELTLSRLEAEQQALAGE